MVVGIIQIFVGLAGIMVAILIALLGFNYWQNRRLDAYYKVIWKKASELQPREVLDIRGDPKHGFRDYYFERPTDQIIREKLADGQSLLVVGHPLAGKTRALFQALKTCPKPLDVIIPKIIDVNPIDFQVPRRLTFWRTPVLLLDDLDKYLEKQNMAYLIQEFIRAGTMIVATCREGFELQKLGHVLEREMVLFAEPVQIPKLDRDSGGEIARQAGRDLPASFDGNIGSILMQLDAMKDRFQAADEIEKGILRALKRLFLAGIYQEREIFSLARVKEVCRELEGLEMLDYQWRQTCERLRDRGFVDLGGEESLRAEEAYLEIVVEAEFQPLDNLQRMLGVFAADHEALFAIGNKAHALGLVDLNKAKYLRLAIAAIEAALTVYTRERFPMQYGTIQNNLGTAYRTLAEVEDKAANCQKAIAAFEVALTVRTRERFPMEFGTTQSNLGAAYGTLAEVEDKAANCRKAIAACEAALTVRTRERFPMDYGTTWNNLGNAYCILAEVEDKAANCKKGIAAYKAALTVRTRERFPMEYGTTWNNLGNAYCILAQVEDKAANCKKAIAAYEAALTVYTRERFPINYAMTQNNLGNAYGTLAEVDDKAANCHKAIATFEAALTVRTRERFPMDYGLTQNNLGNAFRILAEMEDKAANCKKAIAACEAALTVYTRERFPMQYGMTQNNLGNAYGTLADVEDKAANCRKAIAACEAALDIYTPKEFPELYRHISNNLEIARRFCQG
jgi:tetratricopeptide (TPR) repeat protein